MRVIGVLAAVALIATWNMHAASSEKQRARAEADRVDAVGVSVGGVANANAFTLAFVITNNGGHTLRLGAPRVEPPVFTLANVDQSSAVDSGDSTQVTLRLQSRCPVPSTVKIRAVVPVSPPSGRVVELPVEPEVSLVEDLARRACNDFTADEAAVPSVRNVTSTPKTVRFQMLLLNRSDRPFVLTNLTSPGLALSVRGGLPLSVAPHGNLDLPVAVTLRSCAALPPSGRPRHGGERPFAGLTLELRDDTGAQPTKPYSPNADLSAALFGLRSRSCP